MDMDKFFTAFEKRYIAGMCFGFSDRFFRMSTGNLIPLRQGDTLTILIQHDLLSRLQGDFYVTPEHPVESVLKIEAIEMFHGGIEVKALCKTPSQDFESLFRDVWNEIANGQPATIEQGAAQVDAGQVIAKPEKIRCPKRGTKKHNDWKAAWRKVKGSWHGGNDYQELAKLARVSNETIADIVKAGDADLLD